MSKKDRSEKILRKLLSRIVSLLEVLNNHYSRFSQEDAHETMLSILGEVMAAHPETVAFFELDFTL